MPDADRINPGIYCSNTEEWGTPKGLFRLLDAEFGFTLDACASVENAKCDRFFSLLDDGLSQPWKGIVWMNPPYGRTIAQWVAKAHQEAQNGATVVCLLPARTDTAYWHEHVMAADEVRFVKGRLHFDGGHETGGHNAPFPSAVVVFRPPRQAPVMVSMDRGEDATVGTRETPATDRSSQ